MKKNEGKTDRIIRGVIGVILLVLAFGHVSIFASGFMFWFAVIVGIVMLVTAFTGFCPLYRVLGMNTCKKS